MTTPVEELRSAAVLLRQRAERATAGPWRYNPLKMWLTPERMARGAMGGEEFVGAGPLDATVGVAATGPAGHPQPMADATFIATVDPLVGLALADALDQAAGDFGDGTSEEFQLLMLEAGEHGPEHPLLVAARLINGGGS